MKYPILLIIMTFAITSCSQKTEKKLTDTPNDATFQEAKPEPIKKETDVIPVEAYIAAQKLEKYSRATFAGGCFWCTEAAFERINGVVDVISGYSGGDEQFPTYQEVGYGKTTHAESIEIFFDPEVVSYKTLLNVLFVAHDGTQLNRQGPDKGEEYRSAIFYHNEAQHEAAVIKIQAFEKSYHVDIVTQLEPFKSFWVAEQYHQNYYEIHPDHSYVVSVSRPKVEKIIKTFPELLKEKYVKK